MRSRRSVHAPNYDLKEHYKMYKAGKQWLFASISMLTIGTGLLGTQIIAHGDETAVSSSVESISSTGTTSSSVFSSTNSVTLKSSTNQSSASESNSTASIKADQTSTTTSVTKEKQNTSNNNSNTATTSTSKAESTSQSVKATSTSATSQASAKNNNKQVSAESKVVESSNGQPSAKIAPQSSAKSDQSELTSVSPASVATPNAAKNASAVASASSSATSTASVASKSQISQSNRQPASFKAAGTATTATVNASAAVSLAAKSAVLATQQFAASQMNAAVLNSQANQASAQATSMVTSLAKELPKGTTIDLHNSKLTVKLPAGMKASDLNAAVQVLNSLKSYAISLSAKDAATETDYQLGVDAGKATFADGADSFGGSPAGSDTLLDLIGNVIGDGATFTDPTSTTAQLNQAVAQNSPDFSGIDTNVDLTQPQTATANASNQAALKAINQWVDGIMAKLNWDVLSKANASQVKGHDGADFQNGYVDTIKAYAKGELTVEGYYLWLLKLTDSTNNSLYYGTQGYAEQFKTLITALNSVKDDSAYTANVDVKNAYDGGFTTIVAWISADSNAVKEMQDLGMSIGSYLEGGDFTTNDFATNWANEGAKNLIGGISQSMTGDQNPGAGALNTKMLGTGARTGANVMTANFGDTVASYWDKYVTDGGGSHLVTSTSNAGGAMSSVEGAVFWQALQAQYDSWKQIVDAGFEQATKDALAGKAQALDKNTQVLSVLKLPDVYANLSGTALIEANKEYQWGYLFAKGYLDGTPTNTSVLTNETTPNKANQAIIHGYGNTPITAATGSGTGDTDTTIPSPIDLAIYSVLTGKTFTYNTTTTDADGNKVTPIVGKNAQSIGTPAGATNVDWVQADAQPHMYQLIWNAANQAKSDFLADLQQLVNSGNQSKIDLSDITQVLPSDSSKGILTDAQYTYYKNNSYVYYKVFEALYNGYMIKTVNGKTVNVVAQAMTDADNYVKADGDANYGQPTAEDIIAAQKNDPVLNASIDASYTGTLNADRYYTDPYSAANQGTTFADATSSGKPNDADTILNATNLDGASDATKTVQNAINYAFVHEESMAIPAYEAGYAAVQTSINSTPATKDDAIGNPKASTGAFTFENNSTVSDDLTPSLETTNPNGSTIWTVHYTNNDGTALTVYVNRDVPSADDPLGVVKSIQVVVSANGLKDDQGNLVTLKNAAGQAITSADSGGVIGPIGTTAQTSYISLTLSGNVTNDQKKLTTVTVNLTADGKVHYSFNRDSLNSVNTAVTGNQVTTDGTLQGDLYQAGWDYRKTFISNITIKQQVSDPNYVDDKTGSREITADQIYSGFYQTAVKNADGSYTIKKNSSVQLDPNNDVNGTGDDAYGTYKKYTITNLDGSSVDITLNVNGEVSYVVHDLNKNATSGTLDLKSNSVTITNNDITDKTSQFAPSHVVITRTANGAITVSETGIQARMVNKITVENEGTAADTTVVMGTDVEPSYSSTTIVTPVSAMHPGVVFTKDNKLAGFTNGILSTLDDATPSPNTGDPLAYQGKKTEVGPVINDLATDQSTYYGQNQDITTTIQYVANNVENQHSGATAAIDMSTATPTITISLGKNAQNQDLSTSSFDPNDQATDDTGSAIFDWSKTTLPTGWTYDASTQTLKYAPAAGSAESKAIIAAAATGSYTINWSGQTKTGMTGSLSNALVDSHNDVMNLAVTAQVKSQNTINQTINISTDVNSDHQYTFTNAAIVAATSKNDPAGLVTAMIKNLAGTDGKEYTGTMNGLALPAGVSKVKLNADGSVTVTYDPDKATANYQAATGKNIISLVLPLTVDANGNYVPEATGAKVPMANLTLDMTMETNTQVKYILSAGEGSEALNDGTIITFGEPGTDVQTAKTATVALGADFYTDAPGNFAATKTTNYLGGTTNGQYILLTGNTDLSKTPKTITNEKHTSKFGDNSVVYRYAKSAGFVWNTSVLYPKVVDTDTNAQDTGLNSSVDLKDILGGFDTSTLKFTPEPNPTYPGITVGASFSGTVLNFTNTNTKDDPTSLAGYAQLLFTYGFGTSGWLTDAKGNAMYLYVGSDTLPTKNPTLPESDVTININTPSTGADGYQIDANGNATYTFDFNMGDNTVTRKQMMAINSSIAQLLDGDLVRDSGDGALAIIKQYYDINATEDSLKEWQNLSTITMETTPDGKGQVKVTIEPTLSGFVSKQNAAKLFMANNTVTGESSIGGVKIHLNFNTNLTQDSDGLPDALKPEYDAKNDQALGSTYSISAEKVTGYHVTGAKDQNGNDVDSKNLIINTDGTATYNGTYDWGIAKAGDTKPMADKVVWQYAQDTITTGTIGTNRKVYGMSDPTGTGVYTLTGMPDWITVPTTLTDRDFTRVAGEKTGQYAVSLSDQGIKDLQTANPNYTLDATTLANLTKGVLTIKAAPVTATTNTASRIYNGQSITNYKNSDGTAYYVPQLTFTITNPKTPASKPTSANYLQDLDFAVDSNPLDNLKLTDADIFWFDASDSTETPITTDQISHAGVYHWKLNAAGKKDVLKQIGPNYTMTDDQLSTIYGSYTINQGSVKIAANSDSRDYDGQAFTDNHNGKDGQPFAPTLTFDNQIGDSTTLSLAADDYQFKDATGAVIAAVDLKNAGKYTWTLTDQGKKDLYARLGSREDKQYAESDTNYAIDATSIMSGTYTINPIAVTITAPTLTKTYNGSAYAPTDDNGKADAAVLTNLPTHTTAPVYTLTNIGADTTVGEYPIAVTYTTAGSGANQNYTITVVAGKLTITPATATGTLSTGKKVFDGKTISTNFTPTITLTNMSNSATVPTITLKSGDYIFTDAAGNAVDPATQNDAGKYTWKLSAAGIQDVQTQMGKNFSASKLDSLRGSYEITARLVTVAANNAAKVAGASDPTLTATPSTGLLKGDTLDYTVTRQAGETPGDYTITVVNGTNPNYTVTASVGTFTIYPTIKVQYVDQNGVTLTALSNHEVTDQKVGQTISIAQPTLAGYTVNANQPTSYQVTADGQQMVTVHYTQAASVTAHYYIKGTTTVIAPATTQNGGIGGSYTTTTANLPGYTLVATPANANGTFDKTKLTVNYYYTVDYTVVPVDNQGHRLPNAPTITGTGNPGDPVNSANGFPDIPGYQLTITPVVPGKPGQVSVVYTPIVETVTVNYIDQDGKQIRTPLTLNGAYGTQYATTAPAFAHYYLSQTTGKTVGKFGLTTIVITYHYTFAQTSQAGSIGSDGSTSPSAGPKLPVPSAGPGSQYPVPSQGSQPGSLSAYPVSLPGGQPHQSGTTSQVASLQASGFGHAFSLAGNSGEKIATAAGSQQSQRSVAHETIASRAQSSHNRLPQTDETDQSGMLALGLLLTFGLFTYLGVRKLRSQSKLAERTDEIGRKID